MRTAEWSERVEHRTEWIHGITAYGGTYLYFVYTAIPLSRLVETSADDLQETRFLVDEGLSSLGPHNI